MDRRRLLMGLSSGIAMVVSGGIAALGGCFLWSTSRPRGGAQWAAACRLSELRGEEPRAVRLAFTTRDGWYRGERELLVYVMRRGEDLLVLSRRCSHLGCPVRWQDDRQRFDCACHGGAFTRGGVPVAGPPRQPLAVLEHRCFGDLIEVRVG